MDSGHLRLNAEEWEFIFKSLDIARHVFANNPVLQDVMIEDERERFITDLTSIMEKIGLNGKQAHQKGIAPNDSSSLSRRDSTRNNS